MWAAVAFAYAVALLFVPQLNLLNYYFSVAIAVVLPIGVALVAARAALDHPEASARQLFTAVGLATLILLVIPLVVVTVGALWIRNCDWLAGLLRYLLGPGIGCMYGAAVGLLVGSFGRRRAATPAIIGWWLIVVAFNLAHFYAHPPIFAYNPFIGYFNGAVYDNYIPISDTWLWYRVHTLGQAALLLALSRRHWLIAAPFAIAFVVVTSMRGTIGYEITSEHIKEALGGTVETEHFVIHYDTTSAELEKRIQRLAHDHEFRYAQLTALLQVEPSGKIHSFVYGSADRKAKLMGAGRTYIAKPWTREVHLNAIEVGAPVLKHELAHIFGASIAGGPFGIPLQYVVLPRMAMVEGFAVGLTWSAGRLTPHQWSAAMLELGFAAPMERLLDATGFLSSHAGQAYTLSGSFLRWLLDTRGVERFATLYRTGSIQEAYEQPASQVAAEWRAFLADRSQVPLTEADLALAKYRFDAPGKFHSVCALETAAWKRAAATASRDGNLDLALAMTRKVLEHDPQNRNKRMKLADALVAADQLDEALETVRALGADPAAGAVLRSRARTREGDILWLQGQMTEAVAAFESLREQPMSDDMRRRVIVSARGAATEALPVRNGIRDYLLSRGEARKERTAFLETLRRAHPSDPLLPYLLARRYFAASQWQDAAAAHQAALDAGLPTPQLQRAAHEQLGAAHLYQDRFAQARVHYEAARTLHRSAGRKAAISDWIARVGFWETTVRQDI